MSIRDFWRIRSMVALTACLGLGAWPSLPSVSAEDVSDLESLLGDQIVQTGSSIVSGTSVAPATVVTITADDLRSFGLRTLDEAINFASMGMLTEYNMHAPEIGARGVLIHGDYGNHVLLMINGLAINEAWAGAALFNRGAGIPVEMIDRIEVMLGPGSVMYGAQAMLGTINVITKDGYGYKGVHAVAEGEAVSPLATEGRLRAPSSDHYLGDLGGSYRVGLGHGARFKWLGLDGDSSLHVEYYRLHGAATAYRRQLWGDDEVTGEPKKFGPGAGTGVWGGKATRSWYAEAPVGYGRLRLEDVTLSVRGGMFKRAAPYQDALVRYVGDFDPEDDFERDSWLDVELAYQRQITEKLRLSGRTFVNYNRYDYFLTASAPEDCDEGQLSGCRYTAPGLGRRYGVELKSAIQWGDRFYQATQVGVTGQLRDVDSHYVLRSSDGDGERFGVIDIVDVAGAAFVEHTLRPTRWIDVNLGARLDADQRAVRSRISPRAATALTLWSGATLRGIYSEAFRAPSSYELYFEEPFSMKNADLGPEVMRGVEASLEQRFGPHRFFVGGFRSWWEGMIYLDTTGQIGEGDDAVYFDQFQNGERIDNLGGSASYRLTTAGRRLFFETNFTAARTRVDSADYGRRRPTVAPWWFGNARVSYDLPGTLPVLALASGLRGSRRADRYYDGEFVDPPVAPAALDLRGTVSGAVPALPALTYRVSVNYVTAGQAAYTVGAASYAVDESSVPQLQPINRLSGFVGLQYDLE